MGTGLQITGNEITNVSSAAWGGYGVIVNRATTGTTISGNTISSISGGGWARGIGFEPNAGFPTVNATIENNSISGVTTPTANAGSDLYFEVGSTATGTTVTDNSLVATTSAGVVNQSTGSQDVSNNWWGCAGGPNTAGCSAAGGTGGLTLSPWIVSYTPDPAKAGLPGFWPTGTCGSTCYVNGTTGSDSNAGTAGAPLATVQAALDAVTAGGQSTWRPVTYAESLSITKSVSLLGANAGVSGTGTRGPESTVIQTAGTSGVFNITTPDPVTIDGFTGTFTGTAAGGQVTVGGLLDDTQTNNNLTFENNVVAGSTFNNALLYDTSALNSTIANNLFTGTGQIGAGATGIIGAWGSGSQQANLSITGNTFTGLTETTADGTPAININDAGGTVAGNTFTNLHQYGILIADTLANLAITGNTFSGVYNSTPGSSSNRGSGVRTFSNPTFAGPVTVSLNTFTNMYHAVDVANDGTPADLTSGNFTVNRNSFIGPFDGSGTGVGATDSTAINVAAGTVGTLNATCNWWGGVPTPNQLSGSATVSPYLFAASPLATAACGVTTNTTMITSAPSVQIALGRVAKFTVTTHGNPAATVSAVGLPAGMAFTPGSKSRAGTAKLTGAPSGAGSFTFTIHANNGVGPDTTQLFTVHVLAITSAASATFSRSGPPTQSFTVTTSGAGTGVTMTSTLGSKQAGLVFHDNGNGTATIIGKPASTDRSSTIKVTARSGAATYSQRLSLTIS